MADTPPINNPGEIPIIIHGGYFSDQTMVPPPSLGPSQDPMSPTRDVTSKGKQREAEPTCQNQQSEDRRSSRERMTTDLMPLPPRLSISRQDEVGRVLQEIDQETDTLSATTAIDAYTCAFDICKDDYFLWEIQNVMKCIEQKNTKVNDDLSAVYKFAYSRSQVSDDVAREVLRDMKAHFETAEPNQIPVSQSSADYHEGGTDLVQAVWSTLNPGLLYRTCYTLRLVKQLKACFLEAKLHLPHQCVFEYIAIGCPSLRSIKASLTGLNSDNVQYRASEPLLRSIGPKGPLILDRQLQVMYRTLEKLKQAQKLYHDAWRTDDPTTASWTGADSVHCRDEADKLIAFAKEELAKQPTLDDPKEVEIQKRFLWMCSLIEQSTEDQWDYGHMAKWLKFWERMKVT